MADHVCPAAGCDQVVPFEMLACKEHWFLLPIPLRKAISKAWNQREREGRLQDWQRLRTQAVDILKSIGGA